MAVPAPRSAVPGHVYKLPGVNRLFGMDSTLVEGKADIHREPVKGTQKFSQAASAKLNTDDVKTAASSSWASFDKSVPDQPYYWVDPPEEEAPARSALHAQAEDEDEEEDDPELEEDAVPPDLPISARSSKSNDVPEWVLSMLRKAKRSTRSFPAEAWTSMAEAVSTSDSSPWLHLMRDTLLYCFEAVYDGNKSSTRGAERFYNERRLRRGIPQEQVATRQQVRNALHAT